MTNGSDHAFPHLVIDGAVIRVEGGLSKRELFAAMAMQRLLPSGKVLIGDDCERYASMSCDAADALLAALEERKP